MWNNPGFEGRSRKRKKEVGEVGRERIALKRGSRFPPQERFFIVLVTDEKG